MDLGIWWRNLMTTFLLGPLIIFRWSIYDVVHFCFISFLWIYVVILTSIWIKVMNCEYVLLHVVCELHWNNVEECEFSQKRDRICSFIFDGDTFSIQGNLRAGLTWVINECPLAQTWCLLPVNIEYWGDNWTNKSLLSSSIMQGTKGILTRQGSSTPTSLW